MSIPYEIRHSIINASLTIYILLSIQQFMFDANLLAKHHHVPFPIASYYMCTGACCIIIYNCFADLLKYVIQSSLEVKHENIKKN